MGEYERFVDEPISKGSVLNIISQIHEPQKVVVPKFRAWDTFDGDMVNDIFFSWQDCGYESLNECLSDERWKFMQSTGLVDKNGKEIFEGDIVRMHSGELLPVKLHHGMFEPVCYYISNVYEGVGNVFENPELLEHPDFREVNND
ncbi:TPA: hypothetical protein U1X42_000102 [Streptococcus suis]|nr:hypothetical protein [Streptococcus suis]HEL2396043.1 hypothetical protein [Streptococcus suis]HEL9617804.1 hypothetical protein [Streptococcus suis]HEM3200814.1 hypothetical protein [Streptococcus suis]HEM4240410.1 hypothetical protein [Streptococcus suis]